MSDQGETIPVEETDEPQLDPQTNLPKTKKEHSYTYWVQNNPNFYGENGKDIQPKKVDAQDLEKLKQQEEAKTNSRSAWNAAGTWEEKKLLEKNFRQILEKHVVGFKPKSGKIEITSVENISGEGNLILVRGKVRIGFDIGIDLAYKGLGELEGAQGTISYKDFQEDGDHEHSVKSEGDVNKDEGRKAVQASLEELTELVLTTLLKLKE